MQVQVRGGERPLRCAGHQRIITTPPTCIQRPTPNRPQLILVSAGFDASAFDPLSSMMVTAADYRYFGEVRSSRCEKFTVYLCLGALRQGRGMREHRQLLLILHNISQTHSTKQTKGAAGRGRPQLPRAAGRAPRGRLQRAVR
jgi:hypothetical protein